ncbi:hypothetical protein G5B47_02675 [Paenibacillus sp. 7124]|uniref:Uncharacterized protein n=1 Tax=Paenibacillus apii TaxID=1850370 RepID=A0A6M1PH61_9BACL|nr:hypothetical protein [Paenibacillus apii]NGM81313.1 hypothetical protein [Paenibacillus apii]
MRVASIKQVKDNKGSLGQYEVIITKNDETISKKIIRIGNRYRVEPYNKLKLKHRGRTGTLMGYSEDNWGMLFARLKFDDTGKVGKVDIDEIVEI